MCKKWLTQIPGAPVPISSSNASFGTLLFYHSHGALVLLFFTEHTLLADSCLGINASKLYWHPGGGPFDDRSSWKYDDITAVRLECSVYYLHSIQVKYGDTWAKKHGSGLHGCGHNCKNYTKTLATDERITNVKMVIANSYSLEFIHKATFHTNKRELLACGGDGPAAGRRHEESKGYRLQYISGRAGDFVDGLRYHWSEK